MRAFLWTMVVLFALRFITSVRAKAGIAKDPDDEATIILRALINVAIVVWAVVLLAGCGGGDADDNDGRATTQPVDCKAHPEACQ